MNLKTYIEKKLSSALIYTTFGHFDKSTVRCLKDHQTRYLRIGLLVIIFGAFFIQLTATSTVDKSAFWRLVTELDIYTSVFAFIALVLADRTSRKTSSDTLLG